MIQQCIFFTDIYLLVICMFFLVCPFLKNFDFHVYVLFCGGQTELTVGGKVFHWHFTIVYTKQNIIFNGHTNKPSKK